MRHIDRKTLASANFAENALLGQTKLFVNLSQKQQIQVQPNRKKAKH